MSDGVKNSRCRMGCWAMAGVAGLVTMLLLMAASSRGFLGALFLAALVFVFLGLVLEWLLCKGRGAQTGTRGAADTDAAPAVGAGVAGGAASAVAGTATAAGERVADSARAVADTASDAADAAAETASDAAGAVVDTASNAADTASDAAEAVADKASDAADAAGDAAEATEASAIKAAKTTEAAATKAADAVLETAEDGTPDFDGDGALEGANEGTRPAALSAPRGGQADNLKEIKGIGPKLEQMCNSMGFYHFDQIANWTADEIAWVNANLTGFKGRVTRDDWVAQAKILAAGGATEFSKRVDDGKVY